MPRNIARRSILAGISAIPAATAAAALPSTVLAHPAEPEAMSAEVAELTRQYDAARRRTLAALAACDEAFERYEMPAWPEVLFRQPDDPLHRCITAHRIGDRFWYGDSETIDMLRGWNMDHLASAGWSKQIARRAEILTAYDQRERDNAEARDAAGVTATDAEYTAAWRGQEKPLRERILAMRATDPAMLALKVRVYVDSISANDWREELDRKIAEAAEIEGGPWEDAFAASILRDLVTAYAPVDA